MERQLAEKIMSNLRERQFEAYYAEDGEQAMEIIFSLVPNGSRIACGGSETLREIGFFEKTADSYTVIQPAAGSGPDEVKKAMRERFSADAFFLSANAITYDGRIFQEDGASTRVAPMIYGPDSVIIVAGENKFVENEQKARARVKMVACENCRRRGFATPCAEDGHCHDCRVPGRSCCTSVTLNFSRIPGRIKVIVVGRELGI
ncbi:MAG: lactate utilization protein [Oscillospiraceae bacterium]|nr:lactate utilization protein [Oscillospiraceae bacterium]MBQ5412515.1 lactate utilization protein [Oscillospiraceae bacterium]